MARGGAQRRLHGNCSWKNVNAFHISVGMAIEVLIGEVEICLSTSKSRGVESVGLSLTLLHCIQFSCVVQEISDALPDLLCRGGSADTTSFGAITPSSSLQTSQRTKYVTPIGVCRAGRRSAGSMRPKTYFFSSFRNHLPFRVSLYIAPLRQLSVRDVPHSSFVLVGDTPTVQGTACRASERQARLLGFKTPWPLG